MHSHMSYCISVWGSMASSELIQKFQTQQNKCIRTLDYTTDVSSIYTKYHVLTVNQIIELELCKIGYKIKTGELPVNLLTAFKGDASGKSLAKSHNYNTRHKRELNLPKVSTKTYYKSFLFQGIKRHMNLTKELKSCGSCPIFVSNLKRSLLKQ